MKRLLLIALLGVVYTSFSFAQKRTRFEKDGFIYYLLQDENGYEGIENTNGELIIPLSRKYCNIYYFDRCFCVEKETGNTKYIGICDKWGKEIIKPNTYKYEEYFSINYQEEPDLGIHGFYVHNLKDGSGYFNLNIFLDSNAKAYSLKNGSKNYISDGTNGDSYTTLNVSKARGGMVESVWYDHDVYLNGQKGMKIHSKVMVSGYKGQSFKMRVCHFFYYEDGKKLWGNTSGYTTKERDQVAAWVEDRVKPTWEDTNYNDWWVFIPYSALHCNRSCTLKIASVVRDETNGNWLGDDAYVTFINYNTSNSPVYNRPMAQSPFYYPIPKFDFSNVKFDFSNINSNVPMQTGGSENYGGGYDGGNNSGGGSTPRQLYTKTCGVCHGTGTCNTCGGRGVVSALGMGKDHYCTSCRNHDGRCSSCGGRGTWKE